MNKTSFRVSLFVIILMMFPCMAAYAAGLGKLTLNSALGQPLNAEIDIVTTNNDEVATLKAGIASREAFAQAGINYEPALSAIKVYVESRINGNPYIKLTSPQAINDPFLMILMELSWASGRILREYTILLDPVEANTQNLAAANANPSPAFIATELDGEKASGIAREKPVSNTSPKSKTSFPSQAQKTYGPVNRGDTLSSIARQVSPAGVNLNQMLVALYRANRDAFISDNMNLLKVGAVLKIPERNEVAAINTTAATTEIKMQIEDWRQYRGKLAAISKESPLSHTISQSDYGQITTRIDKKSAPAPGAPKEVLKLSSGGQLPDKEGQVSESTLIDRLRMMEEDAIARNLALKEANERVAMLEKSIENLKHLLELKDSVLAQAQIKAESLAKTDPKIETGLPPTNVDLPAEKEVGPEINSIPLEEQGIPVTQPAVETMIQETAASPILPADEPNQSITDLIIENMEYAGAATVLALLLALLIVKRRRNQLQHEEEIDEFRKENFSSTMRSRLASAAAAQSIATAQADRSASTTAEDDLTYEDMDSYSESEEQNTEFTKDFPDADDEVSDFSGKAESGDASGEDKSAFGDSQQAESVINAHLKDNVEEEFDQSVGTIKNDDSPDFANPIDFDLSDETEEIEKSLVAKQSSNDHRVIEARTEFANESAKIKETTEISDYALEIDLDEVKQSPDLMRPEEETSTVEKEKIDLDFDHTAIDLTDEKAASENEIPKISEEPILTSRAPEETGSADEPLEFDLSPEISQNAAEPESPPQLPELGLADINLDLEDTNALKEEEEKADSESASELWQEVETKLDLAKAYQEMDDKEGAKEMLEEVIRDGDAKQKKAARKMLKSL